MLADFALPLPCPKADRDFRFVGLDVETANGDSASICQIGLGCVDATGEIATWSTFVDPQMPFASFNVDLHGIGAQTVQNAPTFAQAWEQLLPFLSRHGLVQHSRFDEKAIDAACRHHALKLPDLAWSNSVTIARRAWPELRGNGGHGLANLKKVLGLKFKHHDAGEDARAAAEVVLRAQTVLGVPLGSLVPPPRPVQLKLPLW
ncbi:exonuclease domain-containing protein [Cognatishimia sp. WU-CL00825]|uniref:3'-5' exonuclease n=1 Tax=Cognatishimia sp. WU-CL00825 TaxID=3127658 RepID=UPI003105F86F